MNSCPSKAGPTSRCGHIVSLMQRVQACSWSPFKLNEIVTLERCLQEIASEDPRMSQWIKKMATETVFVEVSRKKRHLERSDVECRRDADLMGKAEVMKNRAARIRNKVEHYRQKLSLLGEKENEVEMEICDLSQAIVIKENACEVLNRDFELLMERVQDSFGKTMTIVKESLPDFIDMVKGCELLQQLKQLPDLHRSFIIHLMRNYDIKFITTKNKLQSMYLAKKSMLKALQQHHESVSRLRDDLKLVEQALRVEVPEEVEFLKAYQNCIEYLEVARTEPPKKVTVLHNELNSADHIRPLSVGLPDEENDFGLSKVLEEMSREMKELSLKDK